MARYRLRFLLQEIDLHRGATLIGRSPDCQVTIEDPLVSRQHARVTIDDVGARVEDMGSRNGVKVNNQPIKGVTPLRDGDRLRIGTQELVFCELAEGTGPTAAKTTGFLRHCSRCRMPYPQELLACPSCGETVQLEEDTMTGQLGSDTSRSWGLQLLLEVLDKALALGRTPDAVRALSRIEAQIEERLEIGERIEPRQLDEVTRSACTLASATREPRHVTGILHLYPRMKFLPSPSTIEAISTVAVSLRGEMRAAIDALVAAGQKAGEMGAVNKLEQIIAAMEAADSRGDPDQTSRNPVLS